jgi:hypothetical protein
MKPTQKVTIYHQGLMAVTAIEAKLIAHGTRKYAQYPEAPYVDFVAKRKRKPSRLCSGQNMNLLIVEGWNQPKPPGMFKPSTTRIEGIFEVTCSEGKYSACDPRWRSDFNEMIAKEDVKIIADYRDLSN